MYREGDTDSPNMLPTAHLVTMIHGQAFFIITWHPQRYGSSYPLAWPPTWLGMWVSALGTLARKYPADYNTDNDMFDHMAKYWIIQWYFYIWQLYILYSVFWCSRAKKDICFCYGIINDKTGIEIFT